MGYLEAIISGIIQGLTEFLPVSSSGHLSLFQYFTGNSGEEAAVFSVVLHLGTLIAVIIAFWPVIARLIVEFFKMVGDMCRGRFIYSQKTPYQNMIFMLIISLLPLGITFIFKDWMQGIASDNDIIGEGICFIVTGVLLFLSTSLVQGGRKARHMRPKDALLIGLMQAIAPLPGISRSGSTLSVAMMLGFNKKYALDFSFIMGIPAVMGAILLDVKDIFSESFSIPVPVLLVGLVVSLIFGILAVAMVRWLVATDKLRWFSYYTLVLGIIVTALGIYEHFTGNLIQSFITAHLG